MNDVCKICGEPVDLEVERYKVDGKPIHEMCYIKQFQQERQNPSSPDNTESPT
jgi:hypothetical protein